MPYTGFEPGAFGAVAGFPSHYTTWPTYLGLATEENALAKKNILASCEFSLLLPNATRILKLLEIRLGFCCQTK